MDAQFYFELLGYFASILVAIALMMTSILRLRVINLIGAVLFMIYALLISAYPVAIVNLVIVFINIYQLWKLLRVEEEFRILDIQPDSAYLHQFLEYHKEDIQKFLPEFTSFNPSENQIIFFVLRNILAVGLFIAEEKEKQALVKLDYVIRGYRDFKVGKFVYRQKTDFFKARGIHQLVSYSNTKAHQTYLERMGFQRDFSQSEPSLFRLNLDETPKN